MVSSGCGSVTYLFPLILQTRYRPSGWSVSSQKTQLISPQSCFLTVMKGTISWVLDPSARFLQNVPVQIWLYVSLVITSENDWSCAKHHIFHWQTDHIICLKWWNSFSSLWSCVGTNEMVLEDVFAFTLLNENGREVQTRPPELIWITNVSSMHLGPTHLNSSPLVIRLPKMDVNIRSGQGQVQTGLLDEGAVYPSKIWTATNEHCPLQVLICPPLTVWNTQDFFHSTDFDTSWQDNHRCYINKTQTMLVLLPGVPVKPWLWHWARMNKSRSLTLKQLNQIHPYSPSEL